jgi:hypothetical protein
VTRGRLAQSCSHAESHAVLTDLPNGTYAPWWRPNRAGGVLAIAGADAGLDRQPLAPDAVAVLYEVTLGFRPASWHHALLAAEPAALRQLRQCSLVRLVGRNRLEPTEAVLYSVNLNPGAREERS